MWGLELEEKRSANFKAQRARGGASEIDILQTWTGAEVFIPSAVSDRDESLHAGRTLAPVTRELAREVM